MKISDGDKWLYFFANPVECNLRWITRWSSLLKGKSGFRNGSRWHRGWQEARYSSRHADQARTRKHCAQLYLRREEFGPEYKIL